MIVGTIQTTVGRCARTVGSLLTSQRYDLASVDEILPNGRK